MKAWILAAFVLALNSFGCAAWDYTAAMQTCVDTHIGDPQGREQCICQTAADAGRPCPVGDAGAE